MLNFCRHSKAFYIIVTLFVLINSSCSGTHAINCIFVGETRVCFKREVWGRNGDKVWITTDNNVCRQPSKQTDYIASGTLDADGISYKLDGEILHIYGAYFSLPEKQFPVEIRFEHYDPTNANRDPLTEGYQKISLEHEKMTSCLSDLWLQRH